MTLFAPPSEDRFKPFYIPPGTRIGRYTVRTGIGRGGGQMAYLAEDTDGNLVVLKFSLSPKGEEDSSAREMHERFLRQVTFFLQLRETAGVARILGHDMHPDRSPVGYLYLVQAWVPGSMNILDWYRNEPRRLEDVVAGWMALTNVCGEMNRRGICHRDLKPQNVLMTPDGTPKVVDLNSGISIGDAPLTATGPGWPGTALYYSPELCEAILECWSNGEAAPFQYSSSQDLHALGVIFYQVLTGQYPFDEYATKDVLFEQIAHKVPEQPRALNPEVPFGLAKVTMRLLQKNPEKRYQTGDEVLEDLTSLLDTNEDWERLFQTPARKRRTVFSLESSRTGDMSTTGRDTPPPTPRTSVGSAAVKLVPSASVLAGPRALAVREPRQLMRVVPRPPALVAPVESEEPTHRLLALCRHARLLAAVLALALVGPWLALGQHGSAGSFFEKGATLPSKAKVAVAAVASAVLAACAGLTGKVRTGEKDWLDRCAPDHRRAVAELELATDGGAAALLAGPNVIIPDAGVGLRDGPVEASTFISTPEKLVQDHLFGEIRTGTDGASIHFTKLKLFSGSEPEGQPPAGREVDICAVAYVPGYGDDPGVPKVEDHGEPVELPPGFTYVTTKALRIRLAH